eukprot:COSAG01_NODE_2670_length_7274_cov_4.395540_3_plen_88_part_00
MSLVYWVAVPEALRAQPPNTPQLVCHGASLACGFVPSARLELLPSRARPAARASPPCRVFGWGRNTHGQRGGKPGDDVLQAAAQVRG